MGKPHPKELRERVVAHVMAGNASRRGGAPRRVDQMRQ